MILVSYKGNIPLLSNPIFSNPEGFKKQCWKSRNALYQHFFSFHPLLQLKEKNVTHYLEC